MPIPREIEQLEAAADWTQADVTKILVFTLMSAKGLVRVSN